MSQSSDVAVCVPAERQISSPLLVESQSGESISEKHLSTESLDVLSISTLTSSSSTSKTSDFTCETGVQTETVVETENDTVHESVCASKVEADVEAETEPEVECDSQLDGKSTTAAETSLSTLPAAECWSPAPPYHMQASLAASIQSNMEEAGRRISLALSQVGSLRRVSRIACQAEGRRCAPAVALMLREVVEDEANFDKVASWADMMLVLDSPEVLAEVDPLSRVPYINWFAFFCRLWPLVTVRYGGNFDAVPALLAQQYNRFLPVSEGDYGVRQKLVTHVLNRHLRKVICAAEDNLWVLQLLCETYRVVYHQYL
ncbi:hypothetical protein EmuJ_000508500 [Echinococcus multilocularis]|uniref:Uncharacterized protein n=1 Tax=Echinococcus multilocularis TaxID=6211 RepID=A0A068Y3R5_ECHMU|nr:hypothetical protein EmuJ_000508500 [Echinococcus multilocularis]